MLPERRLLSVRLSGSDSSKGHTEYELQVFGGGCQWQVLRRYKEFVKLNAQLTDRFPQLAFPSLPRKVWFNATSYKVVEHRKQALQDYMDEVLQRSDVCSCEEMAAFLKADTNHAALHQDIYDLQSRTEEVARGTSETLALLHQRNEENSALKSEVEALTRELRALESIRLLCEEDASTLRPRISVQADKLEADCYEVMSIAESHKAGQAELDRLHRRATEVQQESNQLVSQISQLDAQLESTNQQINSDSQESDEIEEQIFALEKDQVSIDRKLVEMAAEWRSLQSQQQQLTRSHVGNGYNGTSDNHQQKAEELLASKFSFPASLRSAPVRIPPNQQVSGLPGAALSHSPSPSSKPQLLASAVESLKRFSSSRSVRGTGTTKRS